MISFEEEAKQYLSERQKEVNEAKYRVEMKHSLKKTGIVFDPNSSTKELEEKCLKYL
jgi:hypothetical protein